MDNRQYRQIVDDYADMVYRLLYAQLCNPYDAQWDFSHWGSRYWADTPELRAWLQEHGQN